MGYKFCVINHKSLDDRGMLERNQILERRRGTELDLYGVRIGSSTCVTRQIAADVREKKEIHLTRNERRIGASIKKIRQKYRMRFAWAQWMRAVQKTRMAIFSEADKKQKFFISLWNLKANKERMRRTAAEKKRKARRESRRESSSSDDSSLLYKPKKQVDTSLNLNWEENSEDEVINIMKDKANTKVKIMNVATAMATLGMANARGLEDPSIGPMLLSHAFQSRIHVLEESRAFSLIHQKKQDWFSTLPAILRTQKHTNTRNKYRRYARYTTEHVRKELLKIHDAYQTLRKKYEGKYPVQVPTANFKGNYGNLKTSTQEQAKAFNEKEFETQEEDEIYNKPVEETGKMNLFKRKGAAIGKLAAMNIGKQSRVEQERLREEHEKNMEMFQKKRDQIKKDQEHKKRLSMKVNQIQLELLGIGQEDDDIGEKSGKKPQDDELSLSSGEGEVFVHNLMGFWT